MAAPAQPVVVFAPLPGDADALADVVDRSALRPRVCRDLQEFDAGMRDHPMCAIITQEAAGPQAVEAIEAGIANEPAWSSLPLIFAVNDTERPPPACRSLMGRSIPTSLVILKRPIRRTTLETVLRNQLQLRQRQHEAAELMRKLEEGERYQAFLLAELRHRTNNMLTLVQATIRRSADRHATVEEFRDALLTRLSAQFDAYVRLTASGASDIPLRAILKQHIEPNCRAGGQLALDGPDIRLPDQKAFDLALIVHEMATNAAKYGALSADDGRVDVRWREEGGLLVLRWAELGGPPVTPPADKGFGTQMIENLAARGDATSALRFEDAGVVWDFRMPL